MANAISLKNFSIIQDAVKDAFQLLTFLKPGDVVEGLVLEKKAKTMFVDLDKFGTGAIYGNELKNAKETIRKLKPGDKILGKVINPDNEEGYVEISISEADKQNAWTELTELKDKDEIFKLRPIGLNKGGLLFETCGIKGFLPLSQLGAGHYPKIQDGDKVKIMQALQHLAKEEFSVKIIDIDSKNDKLIFSERATTEESERKLIEKYEVGQIVEGIISGVASFGAFVRFTDNPVIESLIYISELDHRLIENPKEVVSINDVVKAKIIEIKDGKIYLSMKALKPNPWMDINLRYKVGDLTKGKVYTFNPFGAIINLGDVQGQIHISEFGGIEEMKQELALQKEYSFIITTVKPEEKRIYLKLKAQNSKLKPTSQD